MASQVPINPLTMHKCGDPLLVNYRFMCSQFWDPIRAMKGSCFHLVNLARDSDGQKMENQDCSY